MGINGVKFWTIILFIMSDIKLNIKRIVSWVGGNLSQSVNDVEFIFMKNYTEI